jgi:AbrB family looped-hinge helix DNA binding protein
MKAIVSEKGQITIPKAVREKLGIRVGTVLEVTAVEGQLVAWK